MVGVGCFERSAGKATLATLDVRPPSEGTAARGPADSYALEVETMVVIWRAGRPGTHHRRLFRRGSTATKLRFGRRSSGMARSASAMQHGWFRTRHDKDGERLECPPELPSTVNP